MFQIGKLLDMIGKLQGLKFSDLVPITKRNMAIAVCDVTKQLDQLTKANSDLKAHLTKLIQHLDDQLEIAKKTSLELNATVHDFSTKMLKFKSVVLQLENMVGSWHEKADRILQQQVISLSLVKSWEKSGDAVWWKGLVPITKRNMAIAVSDVTKQLDQLTKANSVHDISTKMLKVKSDVLQLENVVGSLHEKADRMLEQQWPKFSDLVPITKRNMAITVSDVTKQLDQLSKANSDLKAHLTKLIQHLDDHVEIAMKTSLELNALVHDISTKMLKVKSDLLQLENMVGSWLEKADRILEQQHLQILCISHMLQVATGADPKMPKLLKVPDDLLEDLQADGK